MLRYIILNNVTHLFKRSYNDFLVTHFIVTFLLAIKNIQCLEFQFIFPPSMCYFIMVISHVATYIRTWVNVLHTMPKLTCLTPRAMCRNQAIRTPSMSGTGGIMYSVPDMHGAVYNNYPHSLLKEEGIIRFQVLSCRKNTIRCRDGRQTCISVCIVFTESEWADKNIEGERITICSNIISYACWISLLGGDFQYSLRFRIM